MISEFISLEPHRTGNAMLALFEASGAHPMVPQSNGVAFSVDADTFIAFVRALPGEIDHTSGERLTSAHLVDFDLCWAIDLVDPWGNRYELNCYDHEPIRTELVEADGVEVARYSPRHLRENYVDSRP